MPIYEFVCEDCGHEFESLQRLSDPLPESCPECSKSSVVKKISAAGFRLKGGGWYETDFKKGDKKNVSAGDSAKSGSDAAKSADGAAKSSDSGAKSSDSGSKSSSDGAKTSGTTTKKD